MTVRRILVVTFALLIIWAAPAAADHTYGHVLGAGQTRTAVDAGAGQTRTAVDAGAVQAESSSPRGGGVLARTGSDILGPLVQGAVVLVGIGSLLALVGRRRRSQRQLTTA